MSKNLIHKLKLKLGLTLAFVLFLSPVGADIQTGSLSQDSWANWEWRIEQGAQGTRIRKVPGRPMGIIVPQSTRHDIYPLLSFGYGAMYAEKIDTVIMLFPAPASATFEGMAVPDLDLLQTSIGDFELDFQLAKQLKDLNISVTIDNSLISPTIPADLEAQLAFLRYYARKSLPKVLPIYVRLTDINSQVKDMAPLFAEHLKSISLLKTTLILMVSDMNKATTEDVLTQTDLPKMNSIRNLDVDAFIASEEAPAAPTGPANDLGALALGILTLRLAGADHGEILAYAHSGQLILSKDKKILTSYVTAAIASGPPAPMKIPHYTSEKLEETFDELFRSDLLSVSRQTCLSLIDSTAAKPPFLPQREAGKKWPVYISIYDEKGELVGHAGSHIAKGPLEETLRNYAFQAMQPPKKISREQFKNYVIEVSVPYGINSISRPEELIPFLNGIIVTHAHKKSDFHPVAWKKYPDPHQLLSNICTKLGLRPWDYATTQADLESFRVMSFNEKEPYQRLAPKKKKKKSGDNTLTDDEPTDGKGESDVNFGF